MSKTEEALKPCPFCGGEAEIERYGNGRCSTVYKCTECGCYLETGEEFNHGKDWNTRHQEGQEMFAVESQVGYSNFLSRREDDADYRRKELNTIMPEVGPFKVVPVLVIKKEK